MARLTSVIYECELCGSEITVKGDGSGELSPIYCCGMTVSEMPIDRPRSPKPKKKAPTRKKSKSGPAKTAAKKVTPAGRTTTAKKK